MYEEQEGMTKGYTKVPALYLSELHHDATLTRAALLQCISWINSMGESSSGRLEGSREAALIHHVSMSSFSEDQREQGSMSDEIVA